MASKGKPKMSVFLFCVKLKNSMLKGTLETTSINIEQKDFEDAHVVIAGE